MKNSGYTNEDCFIITFLCSAALIINFINLCRNEDRYHILYFFALFLNPDGCSAWLQFCWACELHLLDQSCSPACPLSPFSCRRPPDPLPPFTTPDFSCIKTAASTPSWTWTPHPPLVSHARAGVEPGILTTLWAPSGAQGVTMCVLLFGRAVLVCLELSIFIFLAQVSLRSLLGLAQASIN